ncbi:MAG: acyl-CoA desaturase [Gammaproteobacteria bacterium]|nr:acyl-CoA desaturase [Gammaproteobacteria bacterium]
MLASIRRWFVNDSHPEAEGESAATDWPRIMPFVVLHVAALAAPLSGFSIAALLVAALLYAVRMFAITAFYHRYFSHRAFRTSRWMQLIFATVAASAAQRGPLWWAAVHRRHHAHADTLDDPHTPRHGLLRSHVGWFLTREHYATRVDAVKDWAAFPELRLLDRFDALVPVLLAAGLFGLGEWLDALFPALHTSGWQMLLWGFCVSTVVLLHATLMVNSVAHRFGDRRYATGDESHNLRWLAWLTFGEGWHNNHHRYAASARQGFFPGETDLSWQVLRLFARLGLVRDLRPVPAHILEEGQSR